jgi:hypothetical protein
MSSAGLRDAANARAVDTASAMRIELSDAARRLMKADDPRFWTFEWFGMLDRIEAHLADKEVFDLAYHDKHMDFLKKTLKALQDACAGQPASGCKFEGHPRSVALLSSTAARCQQPVPSQGREYRPAGRVQRVNGPTGRRCHLVERAGDAFGHQGLVLVAGHANRHQSADKVFINSELRWNWRAVTTRVPSLERSGLLLVRLAALGFAIRGFAIDRSGPCSLLLSRS